MEIYRDNLNPKKYRGWTYKYSYSDYFVYGVKYIKKFPFWDIYNRRNSIGNSISASVNTLKCHIEGKNIKKEILRQLDEEIDKFNQSQK